jgi:phosphatidylserine decarboxylase
MTLHKEGNGTIFSATLILFLINACLYYMTPLFVFDGVLFVSIVVYIIIVSFFRKPVRVATVDANVIYAPCDGKVVVIEDVLEKEYYGEKRKQVSIFMSPLNVHINWYPVSGAVKYYKYHPGEKLVAWHPKSSELNERSTIVVETAAKQSILFRQIAGALARRIVCYAQQDTEVVQGSEVGFIKFGSRMDLFLPLDAKINVTINQKVSGNKTVIATW